MKKAFKLIGIIAIAAVIGLSFTGCDQANDPAPPSQTGGGQTGGGQTGGGQTGGGQTGGGQTGGGQTGGGQTGGGQTGGGQTGGGQTGGQQPPPVATFTPPTRAQLQTFLENQRTTGTIAGLPRAAYIRSITINSYTVNGASITTNPSAVPVTAEVRVQFTLRTHLSFNNLEMGERLQIDNFRIQLQGDLQNWLQEQGFGRWNITVTTGNTVFG